MVRNFPKNLGRDKRGVLVIDCPPLKPGKECEGLCAGKCDPKHPQDCAFLKTYDQQLCKLDFNKFMDNLQRIRSKFCESEALDDVDFALIVFETPTNSCSERGPLQNWLKSHGVEIEEWQK